MKKNLKITIKAWKKIVKLSKMKMKLMIVLSQFKKRTIKYK